jgi:membrane protein required for colicin V production
VFSNFQAEIDENIPSDAPGWIVERYNELTNVCATGAAPLVPAPEAAPDAAPAAPATNG